MKTIKPLFIYFIVLIVWITTIAAKYKYNGLVFGLDYGLYHPDGTLYTMRTLDWAGYNEHEAANVVSNWYNEHAFKFNNTNPSDFYYSVHPKWPEYYPRVLYPFLSILFVKIFGIPGMLVVPALSLLVIMFVIIIVGVKNNQTLFALILTVLVSGSTTVNRWMMANTTDALFAGIFSLTVFYLLKMSSKFTWFLGMSFLILLSGLTRMSFLFWIGVAIILFLNRSIFKSIYIALFGFIVFVPTLLSNANNSFLPVEGDRSEIERLFLLPKYFLKVTFFEFAQLFVLDRVLFLVIVIAFLLACFELKRFSNQYYLVLLIMSLITGALNGTIGVNFRYQLPVIVFACWSLIDNINQRLKKFQNNLI